MNSLPLETEAVILEVSMTPTKFLSMRNVEIETISSKL